jgi:ABC-2 type transport system permease protein
MLSGFIFAIKNMPLVLQIISHVVPARYYLVIIRGIMLKGAGFGELVGQAASLVAFMTLILLAAMMRFRTRLG